MVFSKTENNIVFLHSMLDWYTAFASRKYIISYNCTILQPAILYVIKSCIL